MDNIPSFVLCHIFSFLTVLEKGRILTVCTKWNAIGSKLIRDQETIACNVDPHFLLHRCPYHHFRQEDIIPFSVYLKLMVTGSITRLMPNLKVIVLGFGIPHILKFIHSYSQSLVCLNVGSHTIRPSHLWDRPFPKLNCVTGCRVTADMLDSCTSLRSINTFNETSQYTLEPEFASKLPLGLIHLSCYVTDTLSSISHSPAGQTVKSLDVIMGSEDIMDKCMVETEFMFPALQVLKINTNRMTPSFWESFFKLDNLRSLQMTCGDANYTEHDFDQLFKCMPLLSKLTVTFSY